jgi:hypothetical protein
MSVLPTVIQDTFQRLGPKRQLEIIYHGAALRLSDLNKRYFLAQSKVQAYEERYQTTLAVLDAQGLPDDASVEMHEDYILWHHWHTVVGETQAEVDQLRPLVEQGLPIGIASHERP